MRVLVMGTGYVGLSHAAVMAEYGHEVHAYDIDLVRLAAYQSGEAAQIERYVNEPGLSALIRENLDRHLFFETDLGDLVDRAEIVFFCINTPSQPDGSTDLSFFLSAAHDLADRLVRRHPKNRVLLVTKSTVPIGTARILQQVMESHGVENFGVASNPEFLPQGNAVEGSRRPDRVVVGADTAEDFQLLRHLYAQFVNHVRIRYLETTPETAEAIKYMSNAILLTYISFWNGVGARLGEKIPNISMEDLRTGVTGDSRISTWGSYVSNGAGGSCLDKDILSLTHQLHQTNSSTDLLRAVYTINSHQKAYLLDRAVHEMQFDFNQKTVALLGLAFKKRTNDMRNSAALKVVESLLARGVKSIRAFDPLANGEAQRIWFNPEKNYLFDRITYCDTPEEAIEGSQALYISTDWEEFRGLSSVLQEIVHPPYLIIDGRRMISDHDELVVKGYTYLAVGSPLLRPKPVDELLPIDKIRYGRNGSNGHLQDASARMP